MSSSNSAASLRSLLTRVDMSAPSIQKAAGAMMKHYDRSATVAVTEWRNALQTNDQLLPLLYIANEVLQNSKRNRGNKFLEAFSPILGQALIYICQKSPSYVEKVRRTVKIWGDRHVFSIRFVNELLKGLEPYRGGGKSDGSSTASHHNASPGTDNKPFSPEPQIPTTAPQQATTRDDNADDFDINMDEENEDDDDLFLGDDNDSDGMKLQVSIDASAMSQAATMSKGSNNMAKRRRSSTGSNASGGKRRKLILSTTSLLELWNRVSSLEQSFDHAQAMLGVVVNNNNNTSQEQQQSLFSSDSIESLVGDELLEKYAQVIHYERRIQEQRRVFHDIANERRVLEQTAKRYLPWLENALKQDDEDLIFCQELETKLLQFRKVHEMARQARDERLREEQRRRQEQQEKERQRKDEEERKRFMESAMKKETEAKPGMVWNRLTQEYQYLNTNEEWRD